MVYLTVAFVNLITSSVVRVYKLSPHSVCQDIVPSLCRPGFFTNLGFSSVRTVISLVTHLLMLVMVTMWPAFLVEEVGGVVGC